MTRSREDAVVARLRAAGCVFAEDEARLLLAEAGSPARTGRAWSSGGWPASRSSTSSAGRSSAGCGSRWTPGCSCRGGGRRLLVEEAVRAAPPGRRRRRPLLRLGRARRSRSATAVRGRRAARRGRRPGRGRVRAPATSPPWAARAYAGDLFERAAAGAARPGGPAAGERAVRAQRRDRADAAGGPRLHEARVALDGGADGLDVAARVIAAAPRLARAGRLAAVRDERGPGARRRCERVRRGRAGRRGW